MFLDWLIDSQNWTKAWLFLIWVLVWWYSLRTLRLSLWKWIKKTEDNPAYNIIYKFYAFTVNLFGFASFFGETFVSLDRFIAVCLFFRYQELVTHKRVVAVMVSKWVCSAVLSFLRLWIPTRISFIIFLSLLLTTAPLNFKIYDLYDVELMSGNSEFSEFFDDPINSRIFTTPANTGSPSALCFCSGFRGHLVGIY